MNKGNEAVVRRLYDEGWNLGQFDVVGDCLTDEYFCHDVPEGLNRGIEQTKRMMATYSSVFDKLHWTIDDMVSDGDRVVVRGTLEGNHVADFMGSKPTGKRVTMKTIDIFRVANEKVVEHWGAMSMTSMAQFFM